MTDSLKVALAQLNPKVGDVDGNLAKVRAARAEAKKQGADLVMTAGAGARRLLPRGPGAEARLPEALPRGGRGAARRHPRRRAGAVRHHAVARGRQALQRHHRLDKGEIIGKRYKVDLPNYGVFDDKRVFAPGPMPGPLVFKGVRIGVPICEDMWTPDVVECIAETGGEILLVPNASPYEVGKTDQRVQLGVKRVVESGLPLAYVNQVGGQDEVIYDGGSFVLGADRQLKAKLASFREEVATVEFRRNGQRLGMPARPRSRPSSTRLE